MGDEAGTYITQGIQYAKLAIQADTAARYQEALHYYELTLQSLQSAIQIDTNESRKQVTSQKSYEYAQRKTKLQQRMREAGGGAQPSPGAAPSFNTLSNIGAQGPAAAPGPGFPPQQNQQYDDVTLIKPNADTGTMGPVLALWVTDSPQHRFIERLRANKLDVLLCHTFAEGMKVLRKNTNISHVINNLHRAGGNIAASTELVELTRKYDATIPIFLTTFEVEDKIRQKKSFQKRIQDMQGDIQTLMRQGATALAKTPDELIALLTDPRYVAERTPQNALAIAPPDNPANKPYGTAVTNQKGLEYFVGDKIGSGNFGVIHDCKDVFGQDFVIKVLKTNRPQEEVQADWAKETQFLYTLNHPNIVQLYDAFEFNNLYHLVMERCSGSLRDYVERHGQMSGPDVVAVGGQVLSGLHHIHQRNIIHRDLHVDNILYAPGRSPQQKISIKISDFGISKLLRPTENAAVTFIGRDYDYCPELVTKGHTTKRSDVYQLGLVLYHMYTGKHALSSKDGTNVVQIVTSGLARSRAEQLGTKLGDVIGIMLRRAPEYRYKDCVETWQHLSAILDVQ